MIPVYMKISGFLSYNQPVELDFSNFDLACISGANGAGKSSLLDAITWALFSQARRRDDAIINSQSTTAEVILEFEYEGDLYRIQRSKTRDKSVQLDFFVRSAEGTWRVLSERTVRETEGMIRHVLRMDYDTFINASFFLQGKADQFAQQSPGARKGILSNILGLEIWETYRTRTADWCKDEQNQLKQIDLRLREIEEELAEEDLRKQEYRQLEEKVSQISKLREARAETLKQVQRRYDSIKNQQRLVETMRKNTTESRVQKMEQERWQEDRLLEKQAYEGQIQHAELIEKNVQEWQTLRQELEKWETVAVRFRKVGEERQPYLLALEAERARLRQEQHNLLALKDKADRAVEQRASLEQQKTETELVVKTLEEEISQRELLENSLQQGQTRKADLSAENKRLRLEMDELKGRISQFEESQGAVCPLCGQELGEGDRIALIDSLTNQGKEKGDLFRSNQEFLSQVDGMLSEYKKTLDGLRKTEALLRAKQRELDQIDHRLAEITSLEADWSANGSVTLQAVSQSLDEETYALEARQALADIVERLKDLGYDAAAHDAILSLEKEKRSSQEALNLLRQAQAALQPLEKTIQDMQSQFKALAEQVTRKEDDLRREEENLQAAAADLPDLRMVEEEYLHIQEQEHSLRRELGGARQKVDVLDRQRIRQAEYQSQRKVKSDLISRLKTLERAFSKDGVPALLIEQALPEIENQANEILDKLTGGNMSVQFLTQKSFKDKKRDDMKETLDILIRDTCGSREYEMFSGGEAFRVNFAIRLALSRVLAQRSGARLQSLVIDEGFGSQDAEGRLRLIEAINQVRPFFSKILVITHLDDLKDAFPTRIEVEKMDSGSTIRIWS